MNFNITMILVLMIIPLLFSLLESLYFLRRQYDIVGFIETFQTINLINNNKKL